MLEDVFQEEVLHKSLRGGGGGGGGGVVFFVGGKVNPLFVFLTIPESLQVKHEPLKSNT